jgi:hypothetical protein
MVNKVGAFAAAVVSNYFRIRAVVLITCFRIEGGAKLSRLLSSRSRPTDPGVPSWGRFEPVRFDRPTRRAKRAERNEGQNDPTDKPKPARGQKMRVGTTRHPRDRPTRCATVLLRARLCYSLCIRPDHTRLHRNHEILNYGRIHDLQTTHSLHDGSYERYGHG